MKRLTNISGLALMILSAILFLTIDMTRQQLFGAFLLFIIGAVLSVTGEPDQKSTNEKII